jgi:hypothetical protein
MSERACCNLLHTREERLPRRMVSQASRSPITRRRDTRSAPPKPIAGEWGQELLRSPLRSPTTPLRSGFSSAEFAEQAHAELMSLRARGVIGAEYQARSAPTARAQS